MLILHKPRSLCRGYRLDKSPDGSETLVRDFIYHDVIWLGPRGIVFCLASSGVRVLRVWQVNKNQREALNPLNESGEFQQFSSPVVDKNKYYCHLEVELSDGTTHHEDNVEDLTLVWPVRYRKEVAQKTNVLDWGVDGNYQLPPPVLPYESRVLLVPKALDGVDTVQLLAKLDLVEAWKGDDHFLFVVEWLAKCSSSHTNTYSQILASCVEAS